MTGRLRFSSWFAVGLGLGLTLLASPAQAQQQTFTLDRLQVAGSPDDGIGLFRPYTREKTIFFAQLGLGWSLNPLHTSNITSDPVTLRQSSTAVIHDQLTQYSTIGFELLDRIIVAGTLPVTWWQDGTNPAYSTGIFNTPAGTTVDTTGPSAGDIRLDIRAIAYRTPDRRGAVGGGVSVFFPTGSDTTFGGEGQTTAELMINGEYRFGPVIGVVNTGVDFRPAHSINQPQNDNGLGIGNEWRFAVGGFVPLKQDKYRLGATIYGQTGIANDSSVGNTFFTTRNTPLEWQVEGRIRFGPNDQLWAGLGLGTKIINGYGAPDFRAIGLVGLYVPIFESNANSPESRLARREQWRRESAGDADKDGIPDDIDACPNDPEDHQGADPSDGCPMPPDRDGDGIPDQYDKCPDVPEDKDGIDDGDGCPEDDADHDGIPDAKDACPKEPGQPSPDPKKNGCPQYIHWDVSGGVVKINQQVKFAYNSSTILPDSFAMLGEIANLLKANESIKRLSVDGHTDDRGPEDYNQKLSQSRANSVMNWLTSHGVAQSRLEAHGYGESKPIESNETDAGRQANRRVEFKVLESEDTNKVQKPKKNPEAP